MPETLDSKMVARTVLAMRVPWLLYAAAGFPEVAGAEAVAAQCLLCGVGADRTLPGSSLSSGFAGWEAAAAIQSDRVCAGCFWVMTGVPPKTFRLWTVLYAPGADLPDSLPAAPLSVPGVYLTNRSSTLPVAHVLLDPPESEWALAIAQSGQKHVLPFTEVNPGGSPYRVRYESVEVRADADQIRELLAHVLALRAAGFSAADIQDGRPSSSKVQVELLRLWRQHYPHIAPYRTSPLLELVLWLITKESIDGLHAMY